MRTRKFFYGDTAVVNSNEKCTNHNGHRGKILLTRITRVTIGTRVVYRFGCECGTTISLRSANMDLVSGIARPFKEWADGVEGELTAMRKNYIDSTYGRLDHLETRQKDIILKRRGEGGERWTLDRLSKYYGITKQRIWSIEKAAIAKFAVRNSDGQT